MKILPPSVMLSACLITTAQADDQVSIRVSALMSPPACTIVVTNSTLNMGTLIASRLNAQTSTRLADQQTQLTVSCPNSAAPGLLFKDLNAGTAIQPAVEPGVNWTQRELMGLGLYNNKPIGAWAIAIDTDGIRADGNPASVLWSSTNDNPQWIKATDRWQVIRPDNTAVYAFGTTLPQTLTSVSVPLKISVALNAMNELNVSDKLSFSGTAEVTLKYY